MRERPWVWDPHDITTIKGLPLTTRARNVLSNAGVVTNVDLLNYNPTQDPRNIGPRTLDVILDARRIAERRR